jgi:hypothetical protein
MNQVAGGGGGLALHGVLLSLAGVSAVVGEQVLLCNWVCEGQCGCRDALLREAEGQGGC